MINKVNCNNCAIIDCKKKHGIVNCSSFLNKKNIPITTILEDLISKDATMVHKLLSKFTIRLVESADLDRYRLILL